jgi:hypothetical protein
MNRHARIIQVVNDTGCQSGLFDLLEADAPTFDGMDAQAALNSELKVLDLRIAIVVPNSRLAYLARMVFNDESHRIVYNDMAEAVLWLHGEKAIWPILRSA